MAGRRGEVAYVAVVSGVRRLLVMCDYTAEPLWADGGQYMVPLESLPLTESTKQQLRAWGRWYDKQMDRDFEWPDGEQEDFEQEGRRLWRLVSDELGTEFEVGYHSETLGRHIWDPAALLQDEH